MNSRGFLTLFFTVLLLPLTATLLYLLVFIPTYFSEKLQYQTTLDSITSKAARFLPDQESVRSEVFRYLAHYKHRNSVSLTLSPFEVTLHQKSTWHAPMLLGEITPSLAMLPISLTSKSMISPLNASITTVFDQSLFNSSIHGFIERNCFSPHALELKRVTHFLINSLSLLTHSSLGVSFSASRLTSDLSLPEPDVARPLSLLSDTPLLSGSLVYPRHSEVTEIDCLNDLSRSSHVTKEDHTNAKASTLSSAVYAQPLRLGTSPSLQQLLNGALPLHSAHAPTTSQFRRARHAAFIVRFNDFLDEYLPTVDALDSAQQLLPSNAEMLILILDLAPSSTPYFSRHNSSLTSADGRVTFSRLLFQSSKDFREEVFPLIKKAIYKTFIAQ
jgi:hypothetical protein